MNAYADRIVSYLLAQGWQVALLAVIVGLVSLALKNRSAHVHYLLWLIVLAKCLVPPVLTVPVAVLPQRPPVPYVAREAAPEESTGAETPMLIESAAAAEPVRSTAPTAREGMALAWAAGVLVFLAWVGGRAVRYTCWLHGRRRPLSPALQQSIRELSRDFGFKRQPKVWLLEDIGQPFVWGLLRGSVYLPADFAELPRSDQRRSVLAHELCHVARFDAGVNLLQVVAQALYWFHPFVWWTNRRIRQEREKCCDEMAVARLSTPPERYTDAIVNALAAERRSGHPVPSLAVVGSVRDIEERIRTMLKPGKTFRTRPTLVAVTVASLIALVTIPTALVLTARAQTPPPMQPAQPVADSDKPEQPRYTARTFNSEAALRVYFEETSEYACELIGSTPSAAPLDIPACWVWLVQPLHPVKDWDLMIREIRENKIPGLILNQVTDADLRHLAGLTELRCLFLMDGHVTEAGMSYLQGLTGLQRLELHDIGITDAGLAHLKGLTGLTKLSLWKATQITDAGFEHLGALTGLQYLFCQESTQITGPGIEHIKGLAGLQCLALSDDSRLTNTALVHLKDLTGLRVLWLDGTQITDEGLAHLTGLTGLTVLRLDNTRITDAGLLHLKGLARLEGLGLNNTQITGMGLGNLKGLTRLDWLMLSDAPITDTGLVHLKGQTGLQELWLDRTRITDAGTEHLKGLAGLKRLSLSGTQVTEAGVQRLRQSLPKLTVTRNPTPQATQSADQSVPSTSADAAGSKNAEQPRYAARTFNSGMTFDVLVQETGSDARRSIGRTPNAAPMRIPACMLWEVQPTAPVQDWDVLIRELSRSSVPGLKLEQVTDADLMHLAALPALEFLDLTSAPVTDGSLAHLKGLTHLWGLELPDTRIAGPGLQHLTGLTGLTWLDLSGTAVTDVGLQYLKGVRGLRRLSLDGTRITGSGLQSLEGLPDLVNLRLAGSQVTDAGLAPLGRLIHLTHLHLPVTQITDAGVEHLKSLTELEQVNLSITNVGDSGLAGLAGLTELQRLWLDQTQITDAGLAHLKGLSRLWELGFSSTQVTDAGVEHLTGLTGLQKLWMANTRITDAGLAHLKGLTRLQGLDVGGTQITDAGLEHLKGLTELRTLRVHETRITDAGIEQLKALAGLRQLTVSRTQVTDAGIQRLKQSLPDLTVIRDEAQP